MSKEYEERLKDIFGTVNVQILNEIIPQTKPCPFCGGEKLEISSLTERSQYVTCLTCLAHGPITKRNHHTDACGMTETFLTGVEAIQLWNKCPREERADG